MDIQLKNSKVGSQDLFWLYEEALKDNSNPESSEKTKRTLLSSLHQATALVEELGQKSNLTAPDEFDGINYLKYMIAMVIVEATLAHDNAEAMNSTSSVSKDLVGRAKKAMEEVKKAIQEEEEEEEEEHASFWHKLVAGLKAIFSDGNFYRLIYNAIRSVVNENTNALQSQWGDFQKDSKTAGPVLQYALAAGMMAAAILTGDPVLAMMAIASLPQTGSQINKGIDELSGGKLYAKIVLEITLAAALAAAGGGASIALEGDSAEVGAEVASASAQSSEESSVEMVEMRGSNASEEDASIAAVSGNDSESIVEENESVSQSEAQDEESTEARKAKAKSEEKSTKPKNWGSLKTKIPKNMLLTLGLTGFWSDFMLSSMEIAKACGAHISDRQEKEGAAIGGAILNVLSMLAYGYVAKGGGEGILDDPAKYRDVINGLTTFNAGLGVVASVGQVGVAFTQLKQADAVEDGGKAQAELNYYRACLDSENSVLADQGKAAASDADLWGTASSHWEALAEAWNVV